MVRSRNRAFAALCVGAAAMFAFACSSNASRPVIKAEEEIQDKAQEKGEGKAEGKVAKDEILEPIQQLAKSYNARDAKGFASAWTETAEYIDEDTGERLQGRKAIVDDFTDTFSKEKDIRLEVDIASVRPLGGSAASVEGIARILKPKSVPTRTKFLALIVRQDGKWLIDSVRENRIEGENACAEKLEPLAWMNGVWKHKVGDYEVTFECGPVANGNFRSHRFQVKNKGEVQHEGTLIVGWDAAQGELRSWVFSSDGSFGDGFVEIKGSQVIIRAVGTLPSGESSSATQIVARKGDDSLTYQAVDRSVGTRVLPNVAEVTLTKSAAAGKGE